MRYRLMHLAPESEQFAGFARLCIAPILLLLAGEAEYHVGRLWSGQSGRGNRGDVTGTLLLIDASVKADPSNGL
jgi:hypothetical protein